MKAGNGVNDSDIGPGSDEDSEQSEDEGAVSEPDKRLTKIANDPIALSAAFAEEVCLLSESSLPIIEYCKATNVGH